MRNTDRIARITISTASTRPLSGTLQIDTATSTMRLDLNEDSAHDLSTQLDRFLTQGQQLPKLRRVR